MNQLVEDLKATKRVLEEKGRMAGEMGRFSNRQGNVCLMGAVSTAVSGRSEMEFINHDQFYRYSKVRGALLSHLEAYDSPILFNDAPTTIDQDVYNLIDKALAEAGGLG